mmetsp:Transcript_12833/g.19871  ORF Transcript_12833/g.19871 Transcript_12833/m.19871 type:complete len:85 (-) Transcript_12833:638-892(-)
MFNWPVKFHTVGKKKIHNPDKRKTALVKEIHFDTLLRVLKQTDWCKTLVYQQFLNNGRWKHEDDSIYSEIELKYLSSTLLNMTN